MLSCRPEDSVRLGDPSDRKKVVVLINHDTPCMVITGFVLGFLECVLLSRVILYPALALLRPYDMDVLIARKINRTIYETRPAY